MPQIATIQTPAGLHSLLIPPYRQILHSLFFRPSAAFFVLQFVSRWGRGLLVILLLAVVGSFFKVMSEFPDQALLCNRMAALISEELGTLSYKDGSVDWTEQTGLPFTGHIHGARLDVYDSKKDFSARSLKGELAPKGLVICHDAVFFWRTLPYGGNERLIMNMLAVPGLRENLDALIGNGSLPSSLDAQELKRCVRLVCVASVPGFFISHLLDFLKVIVFSTVFFTLFQVLFRRGRWREAGKVFSLGLHACIPPLLTALIYYIPDFFHVSFDTAFWSAMILYMMWMYYDRWKGMRDMDKAL